MPDPFAFITAASAETLRDIADVLELRGADPQQHAIIHAYLSDVPPLRDARVLEIGCGTGAVTRMLADWPGVAHAVGVDLSPALVAKARELGGARAQLSFEVGDATALPFADQSFDLAVFHTVLSHCPDSARALAEARRVLRPGAWLAVCEADFRSVTVACADHDPLQACADAFVEGFVHGPWLARQLPALVTAAGLQPGMMRSHGYLDTTASGLLQAWVRRGADFLHSNGRIDAELADALKNEAQRRAQAGGFFGQLSYVSLTAQRKP